MWYFAVPVLLHITTVFPHPLSVCSAGRWCAELTDKFGTLPLPVYSSLRCFVGQYTMHLPTISSREWGILFDPLQNGNSSMLRSAIDEWYLIFVRRILSQFGHPFDRRCQWGWCRRRPETHAQVSTLFFQLCALGHCFESICRTRISFLDISRGM